MTAHKTKRTSWATVLTRANCSLKSECKTGRLRLEVNYEGIRKRNLFKACEVTKASELCNRQQDALDRGEGLLAALTGEKVHKHLEVVEAINQWLEVLSNKDRNPKYIKNLYYSAKLFVEWLSTNHRSVRTWNQLKAVHIEDYVADLVQSGLARDTVTDRLKPISGVCDLLHRRADMPNVFRAADIEARTKAQPKQRGDILNSTRLLQFLKWLKIENPALHGLAMIIGLSGCRVLEAGALRYRDVDLTEGTITITDTETHTPKTQASRRTLPVCDMLLDFLKDKCDGRAADSQQTICKSATGMTFNLESTAYNNTVKRTINKARAAGIVPDGFMFRELRACFITIAEMEANVQGTPLDRYIGHSTKNLRQRHYTRLEISSLKTTVSDQINAVLRHEIGTVFFHNIKAACIYAGESA